MLTRKEVLKSIALAGIAAAAGSQPLWAEQSDSFPYLAPPHPDDDANVCHVGVQMHLHTGGTPELYCIRHLRAFVENSMGNYVMLVCRGLNDAERDVAVRYLAAHGVYFLIQDLWQDAKHQYTPEDYRRLRATPGGLFLGAHVGEIDSSGLPPEKYLPQAILDHPTRSAVHDALVAHVRAAADAFRAENHVPVAHSSAVLSHSLFGEAGVDVICSEIGENIPNMSMMIASNRGAARAYGRPWMIDHSTWWSPPGNTGSQVSPREGHTPWCLFTSLLDAVMGGANFVQLEVDWACYDQDKLFTHSGDVGPLLPWGVAMRNLHELNREIGPRGDTVTNFGILISNESGWPGVGWRTADVRATGLYDGIRHKFMQARDADLSFKLLNLFYPGFERCGFDPEYPGFLCESPLGTSDLVPDNLAAERYSRYKVLVALGYHRATPAMCGALRRYVEAGGILVCGDTLFLDENEQPATAALMEPLIGCEPDLRPESQVRLEQPRSFMSASASQPRANSAAQSNTNENANGNPNGNRRQGRDEWQTHLLHPVRLTTGLVTGRMNDTPYLIENRQGNGRVYYTTALNCVGSDSTHRGPEPQLYSSLLSGFIRSLYTRYGDGIRFSPSTGLHYILNERQHPQGARSAKLLVMNQGDMPYRRDATMRNPHGYKQARLIGQGTWEAWKPGGPVFLKTDGDSVTWSCDNVPKIFSVFDFD